MFERTMIRGGIAIVAAAVVGGGGLAIPVASAARPEPSSLLGWLQARPGLSKAERRGWKRAIKREFGGTALEPETDHRMELGVAKTIISRGMFMNAPRKKVARAAWNGWRDALGYVPPPLAAHYRILELQGRKPRGRPIDLAFHFPDYYNEEIAPELVAYWEAALDEGRIEDEALAETKVALEATQVKMRPLLLDKLRLLAALAREAQVSSGDRTAEIRRDRKALEAELQRSFRGVARRPEVLDPERAPYDRLRMHLEDMGQALEDDDRYLNPEGVPPPPAVVPKLPEPEIPRAPDGTPLAEPDRRPPPELPAQPRPGDPRPPVDPLKGRSLKDLIDAYNYQLKRGIEPWIGTPYRWGNARVGVGTDCSGFMKALFNATFSVSLPRTSRDQYRVGRSVSKGNLRAGDLVFFDTRRDGRVNHVGVYIGQGKFAHASVSNGVTYSKMKTRYYARAYRGARRILAYP